MTHQFGSVAQLVERGIEDPSVGSSSLPGSTNASLAERHRQRIANPFTLVRIRYDAPLILKSKNFYAKIN